MNVETIIVGVLALAGTIFGSWITGNKTTALILYRLDALERKVEKHNSIVERTYKTERDLATAFVKIDELKEDLQHINHEQR